MNQPRVKSHPERVFKAFALTILLLIPLLSQVARGNDFDLDKEYPNYFVHTGSPEGPIKPELLEQTLNSIAHRLAIPYVGPDGKILNHGYMDAVKAQIHKHDPHAKIYLSGGVIRSLLGTLENEVKAEMEKAAQSHKHVTTQEVLHRIRDSKEPRIPNRDLGVGSDLDVLIEPSVGHEKDYSAMKHDAEGVINSAATALKLGSHRSKLTNSIIPEGDVNDFHTQMGEAVKQGGSTMDLLALDLNSGTIRTPQKAPHLISDYIKGVYGYLEPEDPSLVRDPDKQTIRALRGFECNRLRVKKEDEQRFLNDLAIVNERTEAGLLTSAAKTQAEKLVRNLRDGGAQNRFYRSKEPVEQAALKISETLRRKEDRPLIPEFIAMKSSGSDSAHPLPSHLLMNWDEFKKKYTYNGSGYVLHGTPEQNTLAILRGGLVVSSHKQGTAVYGRGAYSSPNYETAASYAKGGPVFKLQFDENKHPQILDWQAVKGTPEMLKIIEEVTQEYAKTRKKSRKNAGGESKSSDDDDDEDEKTLNVDKNNELLDAVFERLGKHVDAIVNTHVIIQKLDKVIRPENPRDLIAIQAELLESESTAMKNKKKSIASDPESFANNIRSYNGLWRLEELTPEESHKTKLPTPEELYVKILGHHIEGLPQESKTPTDHASETAAHLLDSPNVEMQRLGVAGLQLNLNGQTLPLYKKALSKADEQVRSFAANRLGDVAWVQNSHELFELALSDSQVPVATAATWNLKSYSGPHAQELFQKAFSRPETQVQRGAGQSLAEYEGSDLEALFAHFTGEDQPKATRQAATPALRNPKFVQRLDLYEKALSDSDEEVRSQAAWALGDYTGKEKGRLIHKVMVDPHPAARERLGYLFRTYGGDDVHSLVQQAMTSPLSDLRKYAAEALDNPKLTHEQVDSFLDTALGDKDPHVRAAAASSLSSYQGKKLMTHFQRALQDPDELVGEKILDVMRSLNAEDPQVQKILVAAIHPLSNSHVLYAALDALEGHYPKTPEFTKQLEGLIDHKTEGDSVIGALLEVHPKSPVLYPAILKKLKKGGEYPPLYHIRSWSEANLANGHPIPPEMAEALIPYGFNKNYWGRTESEVEELLEKAHWTPELLGMGAKADSLHFRNYLVRIMGSHPELKESFLDLMKSTDEDLVAKTLNAFPVSKNFPAAVWAVIPHHLSYQWNSKTKEPAGSAVYRLREESPSDQELLYELYQEHFNSDTPEAQALAFRGLASADPLVSGMAYHKGFSKLLELNNNNYKMYEKGEELGKKLAEALKHAPENSPIFHELASRLQRQPREKFGTGRDADSKYEEHEGSIRQMLYVLQGAKLKNPEISHNVTALLDDPDPIIRMSAVGTIQELEIHTPEIARKMAGLLKEADKWDRSSAAKVLGKMNLGESKTIDQNMIGQLHAAMKGQDKSHLLGAIEALGRMRIEDPQIVHDLKEIAKQSEDPEIKSESLTALGRIYKRVKPVPQDVIDLMVENMKAENLDISRDAFSAMAKMNVGKEPWRRVIRSLWGSKEEHLQNRLPNLPYSYASPDGRDFFSNNQALWDCHEKPLDDSTLESLLENVHDIKDAMSEAASQPTH